MSQTLHLLNKDLRALRLPLLLLYIVLTAQTAIILRDPLIYDPGSGLSMVQLLFPLATLVTAAMLVQQEPLVGTTAFWMTRPIRRGALLLSKTLFLLVFIVTPSALATLGILLAYGMDAGPAGSALGGFLPSLGVLLVGAVLVASVTPSVPAYLTAWISLIVTSVLLNTLLDKVITTTSTAFQNSVFLFLGVLLIFHQYFTRHTRRTVIGLGVAYFGIPLLSTLLITLWIGVRARGPAENPDVPTGGPVAVGLGTTLPSGVFPASSQLGSETTFSAIPEILEAPSGLDVAIHGAYGDLWADGGAYARVWSNNTPLHFDSGAIEAAMPGFRWIGKPRSPEVVSFQVTLAEDSAFDDHVGKPATLRVIASGGLYAYRLTGAISLVSGARFKSGTKAAVIGSVYRGPSSVQLDLRTRYLVPSGDERFPRILLLNRRREEMIEGDSHHQPTRTQTIGLFSGLMIHASEQRLTFPSSANRDRVNLDDEWLREAELAFLEWVPKGHFQTQIEVNDFRMVDTIITPKAKSSGGAE